MSLYIYIYVVCFYVHMLILTTHLVFMPRLKSLALGTDLGGSFSKRFGQGGLSRAETMEVSDWSWGVNGDPKWMFYNG